MKYKNLKMAAQYDDKILEEIIKSLRLDVNFENVYRDDRAFTKFTYFIDLNPVDLFCFERDGILGLWATKLYIITGDKNDYLPLECSISNLRELKGAVDRYFLEKKNKALDIFRGQKTLL